MNKLLVTADDYGAMVSIDQGIIKAMSEGPVRCISILCNFPQLENALRILVEAKKKLSYDIGFGIHLNLTAGRSLTTNEPLFSIRELITKVEQGSIRIIEAELVAQIERFLSIYPEADHLTHHMNVLNLHPLLFELSIKLAKKYNLPLRNPSGMSMNRTFRNGIPPVLKEVIVGFFRNLPLFIQRPSTLLKVYQMTKTNDLQAQVLEHCIPTTDYLCDLFYGTLNTKVIEDLISMIPAEKSVEWLTHPGEYVSSELIPLGINPGYMKQRSQELSTLIEWFKNETNIQKWTLIPGFKHI